MLTLKIYFFDSESGSENKEINEIWDSRDRIWFSEK